MATTQVTSHRPSEKVAEVILSLCPGGPVGTVLSREGRLLLPRRVSAGQMMIERRKTGLPPGRILIRLTPSGSGTLISIASLGEPLALVISGAIIVGASLAATWFGGGAVGAGAGALVAVFEWMRWRKGLVGLATDIAWLADELRRA